VPRRAIVSHMHETDPRSGKGSTPRPATRGSCRSTAAWPGLAGGSRSIAAEANAVVYGGELHLVARRERTPGYTSVGKRFIYDCRSGMVTSYPSLRFEYGFVQVVAHIPHAPGLWPALWLAATNGKYPPEIDMLDSWGSSARRAYSSTR
jgi:beta-glucanase (GH16 family)